MVERIVNHLKGYLKVRIIGYSPERFLNLCKNKGIIIWDLEVKGNDYEMLISVNGFRKLKPLLKKTQTKLIIIERYGVPFFLHKYRNRKFFFAGSIICCLIIFSLSKFSAQGQVPGPSSGVLLQEILCRRWQLPQHRCIQFPVPQPLPLLCRNDP